ncbi:MAG TPA: CHAT domain-containing tetratricopeptide repeat protein [Puia sp.]|nr:CHAT domain-containing tetratricopeptide repeat protein [Puia sp.]
MDLRKIVFVLICYCCFCNLLLNVSAQCPGSNSVWKKILLLRDSSKLSLSERLNLLSIEEKEIKDCPYHDDSTHAFILEQIGLIYAKQGNFIEGIEKLRQANVIMNANINKPSINPRRLISSYYWISTFFDSLNQVSQRVQSLDSCAKLAIQIKSVDLVCLSALYKNLEYYFDIGDYHRCIDYANTCEHLSKEFALKGNKKNFEYGMWYASSTLSWIINSLLQLKKYDVAEKILTEKEKVYSTDLKYSLGAIYEQLAEVQLHKGDYENALKFYKLGFAVERKMGEYPGCVAILNNIGNVYIGQFNDTDTALYYYRKALSYDKRITDKAARAIESLNVLSNIADAYVKQQNFDSAYIYFQLAFDQIKPGMGETELSKIPLNELGRQKKIGYLTNNLIDKGDAFRYQYEITGQTNAIKEAVHTYKTTDGLLDRIKLEQSDIESKLFWRSDSRRVYEHAIDACYSYNNFEDAFYFLEKSRAVLLNDQLRQLGRSNNDDILQQAQIKKKILQLEKDISSTDPISKKYAALQTELFTAKQESYRIERSIKTHNPIYYQSFLDTTFITLKDVQTTLLKDHQALIELFNGDSSVYSLLITPQQTYLNKIDKKDYERSIKSYISFVSSPALLNRHYVEYNKIAFHLFQLIFGKNGLPDSRIIVSPGEEYFPFESLVTNSDFQSPVYFLNEHAVSYTYSARFLLNDFSVSNRSSKNDFLGVAPVKYASSLSLPSLNGSDKSLNAIERYFGATDNYVADSATKTNFTNQFSKYRIIQLYTHSSDTSSRNEPVIFFQDSALYLSELIPENKPSTQLIVLSACETANGQLYRGEGVFSFNRGFAALGIPSSVTNLWSVDDQSTYKLTELFYKYLARGLPLDIALQNAKKEFIQTGSKEYSLPYYWAAPVLVGKTDAVVLTNNFSRKIFFFSAAVCLLVFFAVKYFIRKRSAQKNLSQLGV